MFFDLYSEYVKNTEVPPIFHQWCATMGVAASLGKNFYFPRGHFNVYPNLYVMLIGIPGTGKGTCTSILQKLLLESGYTTFAADRSSKEKFLIDLQDGFHFEAEGDLTDASSVLDLNSFFGKERLINSNEPAEVFILAEEFSDFIGPGAGDFVPLLTKLWSYTGIYRNRLKNSKSVSIYEPCVNLLGGATSTSFAQSLPPEIIGQGFLARLLPVYGEPTGKRITFPTRPDEKIGRDLSNSLRRIRDEVKGEATVSEKAILLLDRINQEWTPLPDPRFQHYATRRFNQLLKLCLVQAASRFSREISIADIRNANTLLSGTEDLMPKAIGEFGKAKNSDVSSKIMEALWTTDKPISTQSLWKLVSSDLGSISELANLLSNLSHAEKIQSAGKLGWLPKTIVQKRKPEFTVIEGEGKEQKKEA